MMRFAKYFIIYLILVSCGFQSIYVSNKSNFSFNKSNALGEIKISKEIIDNLDSLKKGDGVYELTIETFFKKNVSSKINDQFLVKLSTSIAHLIGIPNHDSMSG